MGTANAEEAEVMLHLPLGHSSGLISEPCHSPLFACKRVFHFNDVFGKVEPRPPSSATRTERLV